MNITLDPNYCECNNRGVCVYTPIPVCSCDVGFSGVNELGLPTCTDTWITVYPNAFYAYRILCIFFTTIALIYTTLNSLYYYRVVSRQSNDPTEAKMLAKYVAMRATVSRTSKVVLGTFSVWLTFDWIVWVVDPMSYYFILPYGVYRYFVDCGVVMGNIYILALLEHIVQFTYFSLTKLKKNELMQKINSRYTKELTIQEMVEENTSHNTIFWVSICVNGPLALLQLVATVTHSLYLPFSVTLNLVFYLYALLLFIIYTCAIYFIWRKYISILPQDMKPLRFVFPVFLKTAAATVISALNTTLAIVISLVYGSWYGSYYYEPIALILKYFATFVALSIFNPPRLKDYLLIFGEKRLMVWGCWWMFSSPNRASTDETTDSLSYYDDRGSGCSENTLVHVNSAVDIGEIIPADVDMKQQVVIELPRNDTEDSQQS